jgi:hypothetical protein
MSTVKVNTVDKRTGSTLTLGGCGTTVTLGAGATQSGFGRTGTVDWCTTAKTAPFTGVSGKGYFVNTACGAVTVTLPASPSAGDIISVADYASTFQTNNLTLCRNGSLINAGTNNATLNTVGQSITLVYVDGTRGWKNTMDSTSNVSGVPGFIVATGGTISCCGDYRIHTFTTDGTFCVSTNALCASYQKVDYMVVAGGGGGGGDHGGGGGAGGYRESKCATTSGCWTASPLASATSLPVSIQAYPVTVGGGGAGGCGQSPLPQGTKGVPGSNSIFSTITSAGGGGGAKENSPGAISPPDPNDGVGIPGGSGGGGSYGKSTIPQSGVGGSGNTPPVSPPQGNPGGLGDGAPGGNAPVNSSGGGGGAGAAGGNVSPGVGPGGAGGAGVTSNINSSPVVRAGGGGGAAGAGGVGGAGGSGIGGAGSNASTASAGTTNTGSGGGGAYPDTYAGGAGGSGVVIIRYKYQ